MDPWYVTLAVITYLGWQGVWEAYRVRGLTIPSVNPNGLLAKLTEEIQKNRYKNPKSRKNQLIFPNRGFSRFDEVIVKVAEASVEVTCPAALQTALRKVFPEAIERPVQNKRRAAIVLAGWIVIFVPLLALDIMSR